MSTSKDEHARQRLVEIALYKANGATNDPTIEALHARQRARFRDPSKGSWCAAGLTAAMEDAGLLVPAPGTPARRGAIALLDWVTPRGDGCRLIPGLEWRNVLRWPAQPGDIIAWLQHPPPASWMFSRRDGRRHAFATSSSLASVCSRVDRDRAVYLQNGEQCPDCRWYTRKGHVAVIVAVDDKSITTVGWNEGPAPGRVMMRRLWRDHDTRCAACDGTGYGGGQYEPSDPVCTVCRGRKTVPRSSTVLWRRPGGLYGIARPVAA